MEPENSMEHDDELTQFEKIKAHFKKHKMTYIVGAGCLVVGYSLRKRPVVITNTVTPTIAPVFNNDNASVVNFGGTMSKIVKRVSDGKTWESITEAATDEGHSMSRMSRHLNGHDAHINGEVYTIIGISTTG